MPDTARIWTFGHLVALVELVAGIVGATWLIIVGIRAEALGSAGRSTLDRAFPFVAGAVVGVGLTWLAARSRRAEAGPASRSAAPSRTRPEPAPPSVPVNPLSREGKREVARVVAVLAAAGVFGPRAPAPEQLTEAVADAGEPVTAETVLGAVQEADWYRPDFRASRYCANLAFHDSHVEQDADGLRAQAADIVRLSAGGLTGVSVVVEVATPSGTAPGGTEPVPTTIRVRAGDDDDTLVLGYAGAVKYLSTVLHVSLARILHERGTGQRLAWLWNDQGVWLAGLRDGEVERLNTELGPAAGTGWAWVDEQPPTAAGDPGP